MRNRYSFGIIFAGIMLVPVTPVTILAQIEVLSNLDSLATLADSLKIEGEAYLDQGSYHDALSVFEREIELRRVTADTAGWCTALNAKTDAYLSLGKNQDAMAFALASLMLATSAFGDKDTLVAESYNTLGLVYDHLGEYQSALANFKISLAVRMDALGGGHPAVGSSYNNLGMVYEKLGMYDEALAHHSRALVIWRNALGAEHPMLATSYTSLGIIYRNLGLYQLASENHERALEIRLGVLGVKHPDVASSYNNLGIVYLDIGQYADALLSHDRALTIRLDILGADHPETGESYANIAEVYRNLGSYQLALENNRRAIDIFTTALGEEHPYVAGAYNNLGTVYGELGEYQKALASHTTALDIYKKTLGPRHPSLALSYHNIGNVYDRLGDYDKALENLNTALAIFEDVFGTNHPVVAATLDNIGDVYFNLEDFTSATRNYEKALNIRTISLGTDHPDVAVSYYNLGMVYQEQGDYETSLASYQRALANFVSAYGEMHPDVSSCYNKIGSIYEELGGYEQALANYQEALAISSEVLGADHPQTGIIYHNIGYVHRYQGDYDSAMEYFQKAIDVFEGSRSKIESAELRASYTETVCDQYQAIIGLLMETGRAEEAFGYLERSKSKALQDALADRYDVDVGAGVIKEKIEESMMLAAQVEALETQLISEQALPDSVRNQMKIADLSRLLAETKESYFRVAAEIQADPDYAFAVKVEPVEIGVIRQDIPPGQCLLMTYAGQDELYLFLVSATCYEVRSVPVGRDSLDALIESCRDLCGADHARALQTLGRLVGWSWEDDGTQFYRNEVAPFREVLTTLYAYLVEPFADQLSRAEVVTFIPSGNLYYLPWGALLDNTDSLVFLTERFNWNILTSTELLKCIYRRESGTEDSDLWSLVLVGNPTGAGLPAAEEEVASIMYSYPNSTTLIGDAATEQKVMSAAPTSQALHLATHCILDSDNPWESYIQLARTEGTDGHWTASEISGQSWDSVQLVTLSACETVTGGSRPGLELESMAKAFSLAMEGPPSIVATLWQVADESTKEFMVAFYTELKTSSKSEALRRAQLALINDSRYSHPFFWAPFILIGEWR